VPGTGASHRLCAVMSGARRDSRV